MKMMMKLFLVSTKSNRFHKRKDKNPKCTLSILLDVFVNPYLSINNSSVGLVGYNVRLTKCQAIRGRSPVRFWYGILFLSRGAWHS